LRQAYDYWKNQPGNSPDVQQRPPGKDLSSNRQRPSETRSRFQSSHSNGQRTARQTTNFFRPLSVRHSQGRQTLGQQRPHDTTQWRTDLALKTQSSARLLSTLGKLHRGGLETEHPASQNTDFPRKITLTGFRSAKGQSETSQTPLLFPSHRPERPPLRVIVFQ